MRFLLNDIDWYIKRKRRKANILKTGYSQYGQDVTVMELLGNPGYGTFVDIGANDGVTFSNSLLFEERGWNGICVEPHPVIFSDLQANRSCHLLNACIAERDETVNFMVIDGPGHMLSGIAEYCDAHHMQRVENEIKELGGSRRIIEIEAVSPQTLIQRFQIESIDYLSIDTEGCELQILETFDFSKIPVEIIGVENNTRTPVLARYLSTIGYKLIKSVGCDELYRRK